MLELQQRTGASADTFSDTMAAMSTKGAMSAQQISDTFAELFSQSANSSVSLDALINSMVSLQAATKGTTMNWQSTAQMSQAMKALRPGYDWVR